MARRFVFHDRSQERRRGDDARHRPADDLVPARVLTWHIHLWASGLSEGHGFCQSPLRCNILYRFEIGDLSFAHLGDLGTPIVDAEREALEDIDILLLPVGGNSTINAKEAVAIVNELEPKIVIPMHYAIPGMPKGGDPVDKFLKEIAATKAERVNRFKISKKDLPAEETKIIVLEKA